MATSTMKVKVDLDVPALLVKLLDDALHEERALRQQLAMAAAELRGIPPQTLAALRAHADYVVPPAQGLGCASPAERLQLLQEREAWKAEALAWRETWVDSPTWPYVLAFARAMEAKLDLNRHKGNRSGWLYTDPADLLDRLREEVDELAKAAGTPGRRAELTPGEAADVANFAMMVADVVLFQGPGCDGLTPVRKPPPAAPWAENEPSLIACDECGETPEPGDPGQHTANGRTICVFCGYWKVPPGGQRALMRRQRRGTPNGHWPEPARQPPAE